MRRRGSDGALWGLVVLVAFAIGAGGTVLAFPASEPPALTSGAPSSLVPVTERSYADERQVQLMFETGSPRVVIAPRSGVLTELDCTAGGELRSGSAIARIDGQPVIALATATPLWRDVALGDTGADVRALQQELNRLGSRVVVDGIAGRSTIRAGSAMLRTAGMSNPPPDRISLDAVTWIPSDVSVVRSCAGTVGTDVQRNDTLVELPSELRGARLEQLPVDPVAGRREVRVGSTSAPIGSDGVVNEAAALEAIAGAPEYATAVASSDAPSTTATWRLADPIEVAVVPPTALWDVRGGSACIRSVDDVGHREDRRVEVVGSQLGQSFVRTSGGKAVRSVVARPTTNASCR